MFRRDFVKIAIAGICGAFAPVSKAIGAAIGKPIITGDLELFKHQLEKPVRSYLDQSEISLFYITQSVDDPDKLQIDSLTYRPGQPFSLPAGLKRIDRYLAATGHFPYLKWDSAAHRNDYTQRLYVKGKHAGDFVPSEKSEAKVRLVLNVDKDEQVTARLKSIFQA